MTPEVFTFIFGAHVSQAEFYVARYDSHVRRETAAHDVEQVVESSTFVQLLTVLSF